MAKPNLLIVGAAKSGTTSLHNYLNQHHDVFMCDPKEPHFLINNEIGTERISVGVSEKIAYEKLFLDGENLKYRGESSVMYLMYPEIVIPKIKEYLGNDVKIIIMLRNPVERAYSGYQHVKRYNIKEDISEFRDAWDVSEERYFSNPEMTPASRYKELGMYYKQVKSYLKNFNVHVIIYEDYKEDIQNEMNKVFDFLEINRMEINFDQRHMVGGWQWENQKVKSLMIRKNLLKSFLKIIIPFKTVRKIIRKKIQDRNTSNVLPISMEDKKMLKHFYKDDVRQLSKLIDRDLNYWTK
tara:strand:- start:399 stop:1286 length:888 start_codon:yes stop_codon:yes gene_type:complete